MPEKTMVDYDEENDDLLLRKGKGEYEASIEIGDFIVDFSKKEQIIGIEIMNASKNLSISKALLNTIRNASMNVSQRNHATVINALLILENRQEIRTAIPIPICA
jgi:uncharacterized protein YuzE